MSGQYLVCFEQFSRNTQAFLRSSNVHPPPYLTFWPRQAFPPTLFFPRDTVLKAGLHFLCILLPLELSSFTILASLCARTQVLNSMAGKVLAEKLHRARLSAVSVSTHPRHVRVPFSQPFRNALCVSDGFGNVLQCAGQIRKRNFRVHCILGAAQQRQSMFSKFKTHQVNKLPGNHKYRRHCDFIFKALELLETYRNIGSHKIQFNLTLC